MSGNAINKGSRIWSRFQGIETTVATVAAYMRDHDLSPADVLADYDQWLGEQMRGMVPETGGGVARKRRNSTFKKRRHRAGDAAEMPDACPQCSGAVHMEQLCSITSPHWRTQLACKNDGCNWHGLSVLPIDALLAMGADGIKKNTEER